MSFAHAEHGPRDGADRFVVESKRMMQRLSSTTALAVTLCALAVDDGVQAGPINPAFTEIETGAIAEFRGNGDNSSWSFGTGVSTFDPARFQDSVEAGVDVAWQSGQSYDWSFDIDGSGAPSLTVGGGTVSFGALTSAQLAADTLAIHAKRNVAFTYDFGSLGSGSLTGDPANAFGVDYAYLDVSGLSGLSGSGTITFVGDPIQRLSTSGVTFKAGNLPTEVPEPATLALVGAGLAGVGLAARRRRTG
jgi:hypothetical protein